MHSLDMLLAALISFAAQIPALFYFAAYSDRNGRIGIYGLWAILMGSVCGIPDYEQRVAIAYQRFNHATAQIFIAMMGTERLCSQSYLAQRCVILAHRWAIKLALFRGARANSGNSLARYIWQSDLDKRIHRFGLHTDLALCACLRDRPPRLLNSPGLLAGGS